MDEFSGAIHFSTSGLFCMLNSEQKKALMLCIKAFPCRHSGEKVEGLILT
jgi:hypothetical protein